MNTFDMPLKYIQSVKQLSNEQEQNLIIVSRV